MMKVEYRQAAKKQVCQARKPGFILYEELQFQEKE
jgi:hypothetical protein